MKFRKKPVIIDAVQLLATTIVDVCDFIGEHKNFPECEIGGINPWTGLFTIKTLEGNHEANVGDWIIKGVEGEFYPCKPAIFDKTYEKVED